HGALPDHRDRNGDARHRRLRHQRAGADGRRLPDGMARARACPGRAMTRGHIVIDDVVKVYDPQGAAVMAVDHCTLEIEPGEICMIVGPSGCGKTTLLNAVAGFHEVTSGRIIMDGEVLCSPEKPRSTPGPDRIVVMRRSEEHTSELQSRFDLVCRLLLEKKKFIKQQHT